MLHVDTHKQAIEAVFERSCALPGAPSKCIMLGVRPHLYAASRFEGSAILQAATPSLHTLTHPLGLSALSICDRCWG